VLLHLSFWGVYLSFFVYQISAFRGADISLSEAFSRAGVQVAFNMAVAYLNYFILLPRFLKQKKLGKYLLEFTVPFVLLMVVRVHLQRYLIDGYTYQVKYFYGTTYAVQAVATTLFIVVFIAMLRFAKDWFEFQARQKEVENERLISELNFLKAQINPHFLFNTLNNLYYLAYSKSDNTTEVIAKLSQMMRYMIYDSNHPQVLLSKELDYMQSYIDLEKLRLSQQVPITFSISGDVDQAKVVPLILITFLENAFKHGVNGHVGSAWINMRLHVSHNTLHFTVENSKFPQADSTRERSGIGLQNVKRRLELSYPEKHQLNVSDLPDRYAVELTLDLQ
jgi:LytS/YehU family sensor histidine kinase